MEQNASTGAYILLVEDNEGDVRLVMEALEEHGVIRELRVARDGHEAIKFLNELESDTDAECPALVLLDLNLPRVRGEYVLARIRQSSRCRDIPVVVLTSSDAPRDRALVTALGATGYWRKPPDLADFFKLGEVVKHFLDGSKQISASQNG